MTKRVPHEGTHLVEPGTEQASPDRDVARRHVDTLAALVDLVPDPSLVERLTRDVDDDYLVALAREHDVDFIVTGDKDLLEWREQVPPVITPAAFEAFLGSG